MTATSPDGGVSGEILDVSLTNETDRELTVLVPCGLIFTPVGGEPDEPEPEPEPEDGASPIGVVEVQRMMVVQPVVVPGASLVFLPPSGTTFLTPYVMCIDSERPAPESGAVYGVGEMATDELLALATCVCERDLGAELDPAMGDMSLQLAIWAASEGALPDMTDDLSELDGALADLVGDGIGLDLEELEELTGLEGFDLDTMLAQALQFMDDYQASASTWLEECGIELEE